MTAHSWVKRARRGETNADVKNRGRTCGQHLKRVLLSAGEADGMPRVEVKCGDSRRNTGGEGGLLDNN